MTLTDCQCNYHNFQDQFFPDEDYLCNTELESIGNIVGVIPASVKPVMEYDKTWLTSVALTTTTDHAVAIIGTGQGFIKKVRKKSINP